jgi:hypothetical protein
MENKKHEVSLGTIYDLNKQVMAKEKPLKKAAINDLKKKLEDWFNMQIDCYAMLLCRERYDFTIFHLYEKENVNPPRIAANELIDVLNNRGEILSIEKDGQNICGGGWEIWIKIGEEAFAYYLFNCDDWTIEC